MRQKALLGVVVVCLALLAGSVAFCGEPDRGGRGFSGSDRFRQMMLERLKDTLGVEDDSWTVLKPRLETVMALSRETGSGGGGMRGLFGRRRPGDAPEEPAEGSPATERARRALEKTLENKEAKPEEIKARLKALREAREAAKDELVKAKDKLREILTQRQEAQLVLYGFLD